MSNNQKGPAQFAELIQTPIPELAKLAKASLSVYTAAKNAATKAKSNYREDGKILAALKHIHGQDQATKKMIAQSAFKDWYENLTGKSPNGHALACSNVFQLLVRENAFISEMDYDYCASGWLETSSAIISAHLKEPTFGKITDDLISKRVCDVLRTRPQDGAKRLDEIKAEVKPRKDTSEKDPTKLFNHAGEEWPITSAMNQLSARLHYWGPGTLEEQVVLLTNLELMICAFEQNGNFTKEARDIVAAELEKMNAAKAEKAKAEEIKFIPPVTDTVIAEIVQEAA